MSVDNSLLTLVKHLYRMRISHVHAKIMHTRKLMHAYVPTASRVSTLVF